MGPGRVKGEPLAFSPGPRLAADDEATAVGDFEAEVRRVAQELGENIDEEELQDMINQADRDGDGEINIDEFYRIMKKKGNFLEDLSSDDDF